MKVKFGSIITAGRGTLGGHVYSENHYGPYARTKVNPAYVSNTYTQNVRNNFQAIQVAWRSLTQAQRDAWQAATPDYPKTDFTGTVYFLTGYNLFISINIPYYEEFGAILPDPPVKIVPTVDLSGTLSGSFGGGALDWVYNVAPSETDVEIQIFSTRALSAGINYVSTELRLIDQVSAAGQASDSISAPWVTKFGAVVPVTGEAIFVKMVPVNVKTGDYGVSFQLKFVEP